MAFSFLAFLKAAWPIVVICFWRAVALGLLTWSRSGDLIKTFSRLEQFSKVELAMVVKLAELRSAVLIFEPLKALVPMVVVVERVVSLGRVMEGLWSLKKLVWMSN